MSRYHFDLAEARQRTGVKWTRYGPDVIPLWVADMDYPVADPITEVLESFVKTGEYGYTHPREAKAAVEAASRWFQDHHDYASDPELSAVTRDVMQGVAASIMAYTDPGDGIVVPTPIYPPFPAAVRSAGRRFLAWPLDADHQMDLDRLESLAQNARAILLSSPHNPTGRVFNVDELTRLIEIAERHDLVIISDEIHADLVFDPHRHLPIATLPGGAERTVTIVAASKTFNMAGIGCGIVFFGSPDLAKRFNELPTSLVGHPRAVNVRASEAAWRAGRPWLDETLMQLSANRSAVQEWCQSHEVPVTDPEATYLSWLDLRKRFVDASATILERCNVALNPGSEFEADAGFARLNFATSPEILNEALGRMSPALGKK